MKRRYLLSMPFVALIYSAIIAGSTTVAWGKGTLPDEPGAALFGHYCSACHGSRGQGGVGVPLSLPSFIDSVDDAYLRNTIRLGRPGRVMPKFHELKNKEVDALIHYMRSWTGKHPAPYPAQHIKGDVKKGQKLYAQHCASCHGPKGEGGHGTGVSFSRPRELPILAPALNNLGFLVAAKDAMIKKTLVKGRQGTPMSAMSKIGLSEKEIDNIVAFVRSFEQPSVSAATDGRKPEAPIIVRDSPYNVEQTVENLKSAVLGANMRVIRVQTLDRGLVPPGEENKKQMIVYSCGFNFLYRALKVDPRVGLFLPCRVTVVEHKGKVKVMAINPKRLAAFFNNDELYELCNQMRDVYVEMIEEAIL